MRGTGQPPTLAAPVLTVTEEGIWVDGERSDVHTLRPASTTIFFKPEHEAAAGRVTASWCLVPASAPAQTPSCEHALPEALPTGPSRSIAWSDPASPYGDRVVTGLPEGVSLRLDGAEFRRVLGLGESAGADPGAALGAAFANAREGWLGAEGLPVHLTTNPRAQSPHAVAGAVPRRARSRSRPSPARPSARSQAKHSPSATWARWHASSPGGDGCRKASSAQVGTWKSRACEQSRGRRRSAPTRSAIDGQMWLWRGETGLWERDPATPANFRGNLLGVAFDPGDPARGYAVGSGAVGSNGVLLRYGKTWTEVAPLPAQVQGASFTSDRLRRLGGDRRLPQAAEPRTQRIRRRPARRTTAAAGRSTPPPPR